MSLALSGSHGCGKTTLARAVAQRLHMPCLETSTAAVFKRLGLPFTGLTFEQRLAVQTAVLENHVAEVRAMGPGPFVTDRSTIDFAAYFLAEHGMTADAASGQDTVLMNYVDRCMTKAQSLYGTILLVQPGIEYVADETRPKPSVSYQELFNAIIHSMLHDTRIGSVTGILQREMIDLDERVAMVLSVWHQGLNYAVQSRAGAPLN